VSCLECGSPSRRRVAEEAHLLRRQAQLFGDTIGRPAEPAFQQFVTWLVENKREMGTDQ